MLPIVLMLSVLICLFLTVRHFKKGSRKRGVLQDIEGIHSELQLIELKKERKKLRGKLEKQSKSLRE